VLDHPLNSRTVYMNPIVRFLYWNMNYHVEHHMFPMVPYHALPALHEEMKADAPRPYSGFLEAYREIIPAVLRQVKGPGYYVKRQLPPGARPFTPPAPLKAIAAASRRASDGERLLAHGRRGASAALRARSSIDGRTADDPIA
jgi:hypothetical protein